MKDNIPTELIILWGTRCIQNVYHSKSISVLNPTSPNMILKSHTTHKAKRVYIEHPAKTISTYESNSETPTVNTGSDDGGKSNVSANQMSLWGDAEQNHPPKSMCCFNRGGVTDTIYLQLLKKRSSSFYRAMIHSGNMSPVK